MTTRYQLLERIGVGGMAEVFRGKAVAAGGFEKPVAIKRILPHLSEDQRFVQLLIAEAKILSQLRHRNIVQIYDVGLGDDAQYFLVMEYVEGTDLGDLYDKLEGRGKRLPPHLALHIGAEVCEALDHAHRARGPDGSDLGLVHRDVSPSNVMLSRSGEVKLTDFGIAKRVEESTGHGGVRGKFAYISPEQAGNEHVDGRSDVFSLGVVMYELVLGHRLFSRLADFQALRAVMDNRIPRPREIDRQLSPELEEILLTALAPDPDDRFASAGAFGARLRDYRYGALSTGGDPASEISQVLERYGDDDPGALVEERTVVRIRTAAGFSEAGVNAQRDSFQEARAIIDAFEEETRAVDLDAAELFAEQERRERREDSRDETLDPVAHLEDAGADLEDEATTIMVAPEAEESPRGGLGAPAGPRATGGPDPIGAAAASAPARSGAKLPPPLPRPVEPPKDHTVRELYYSASVPRARERERSREREPARRGHRGLAALAVAAALVAAAAFVIAAGLMDPEEGNSPGAAPGADAGTELGQPETRTAPR